MRADDLIAELMTTSGDRLLRLAFQLCHNQTEVPDAGFAEQVVDADQLWRALETLPPRQRTVLVLRYYEDLPDREIAALISARETTVRSFAARALQQLRSSNLIEERP